MREEQLRAVVKRRYVLCIVVVVQIARHVCLKVGDVRALKLRHRRAQDQRKAAREAQQVIGDHLHHGVARLGAASPADSQPIVRSQTAG